MRSEDLFATLPEAMLVLDDASRVQAFNPAAEQLFGWGRDEALQRSASSLLALPPPERAEWAVGALASVSDDPALGAGVEAVGKRRNGGRFAAWIRAYRIESRHVLLVRDISEYQRLSTLHRATEDRVQRLLESVRVIPWEADVATNQFTWVGPQAEAILGYPAADWSTRDFWPRHMHPDDREEALAICAGATEREEHYSFDYRMIAADGRVVWITDIVAVARWHGRPHLLTGYMLDVTATKEVDENRKRLLADAKAAREKAEEALRVRDEFLSVASHELRTPLTGLELQLDVLRRLLQSEAPSAGKDKLAQKVEAAARQTGRLTTLVEGLLDVSRISRGIFEIELEELDLSALVHEVVGRFAELAARAGSELVVRVPGKVVGRWDALRIDQALTNLMSNALKYAPGAPVEIELEVRAEHVRLSVTDHGAGIASEDMKRIFERFERAVNSKHYGGFGLGLYITKQIVEAHGGSIEAESELGHGSVFSILLPRFKAGPKSPRTLDPR